MSTVDSDRIFNFNIGLLGHVDSGKTSLAKALSTVGSTAAFDKSPESKSREMTIDLGFSAFFVDATEELTANDEEHNIGWDKIQFTLVDCPGHASLLKTIIGGAQIIDLMILVIDVEKGIQTQTAECVVIGDITTENLLIVFNKVDKFAPDVREKKLASLEKKIKNALKITRFGKAEICYAAANPKEGEYIGIEELKNKLTEYAIEAANKKQELILSHLRNNSQTIHQILQSIDDYSPEKMIMAVDHCFNIKGKGIILTGTLLSGSLHVGQTMELPYFNLEKKVKSIQMFHQNVECAYKGDRIGVAISQFKKKFERGLACSPGMILSFNSCIVEIKKIKFYQKQIKTNSLFHINNGHLNIVGKTTIFSVSRSKFNYTPPNQNNNNQDNDSNNNNENNENVFDLFNAATYTSFFNNEFEYNEVLNTKRDKKDPKFNFALIEFTQPFYCPNKSNTLVIGSNLAEISDDSKECRLAFQGRVISSIVR
eukprot:TRINITY_DN239_c3_g1_i2.p1 TRINITY_DN239_c3_g1~~TRINITY_DN239_c3_g1_i2.p1  ORF type:complete len:496 (+),score=137.31 TRINITY_DN239_c3_g1_i2:38-1489(+)